MSTISVGPIHFAAGHRILNLPGRGNKCRNIHGHTFSATWTWQQDADFEFGNLKERLKGLIKRYFDHTFIVDKGDDFYHYLNVNGLNALRVDGPPTTERIAAEIAKLSVEAVTQPYSEYGWKLKEDEPVLYPDAVLLSVKLQEGPENTATWERPVPDVNSPLRLSTYGSGATTTTLTGIAGIGGVTHTV